MAGTPPATTALLLRRLERLSARYGGDVAPRKRALLRELERAQLQTAAEVKRLHEVLCWLRAYPDDRTIGRLVERLIRGFARRRDLNRHAEALKNTGIVGTPIHYRFFYSTAVWLAERWPGRLTVEWETFRNATKIEGILSQLGLYAETLGLDELSKKPREWIDTMRGPRWTDAAFLIRSIHALGMDSFAREQLYDDLDPPMRLAPASGTPARTHAKAPDFPIHFQRGPIRRGRPRLGEAMFKPPHSIRALPSREGERFIEMARAAMVTRSRDLDAFAWGDPRDVRLVDCGEGLHFVVNGVIPERRLPLEGVYAFLILKNGVPIGYVLASALFRSSEIAFNVFETFRGAEAAHTYGRVLATTHALFGSDAFTVYPYQLGDDNDEALQSGAWWFYQKLGFRARDRGVLRLMRQELRRMRLDPAHRSSIPTLRRLAARNVFYFLATPRTDVIGILPIGNIGLAVTRYLARRFGVARDEAREICARDASNLLGVRSVRGWAAGERLSWERWSPLILALPGIGRWNAAEKQALIDVIRAKGGRRESDYVWLLDRHRKLRSALITAATAAG